MKRILLVIALLFCVSFVYADVNATLTAIAQLTAGDTPTPTPTFVTADCPVIANSFPILNYGVIGAYDPVNNHFWWVHGNFVCWLDTNTNIISSILFTSSGTYDYQVAVAAPDGIIVGDQSNYSWINKLDFPFPSNGDQGDISLNNSGSCPGYCDGIQTLMLEKTNPEIVWVCDQSSDSIIKVDFSTGYTVIVGQTTGDMGQIEGLAELTEGGQEYIYTLSEDQSVLYKVNATDMSVTSYESMGEQGWQIATDGTYIYTFDNTDVYQYTADGIVNNIWELPFGDYLAGIAYYDGFLCVLEAMTEVLLVYDTNGVLKCSVPNGSGLQLMTGGGYLWSYNGRTATIDQLYIPPAPTPTSTVTETATATATIQPTNTPAPYYAVACGNTNNAWGYGITFTADDDSLFTKTSFNSVFHQTITGATYPNIFQWQNQSNYGDITYTVSVTGNTQYICTFDFASFIGSASMDISINATPVATRVNPYNIGGNYGAVSQTYLAYPVCYLGDCLLNFDFHPSSNSVNPKAFINAIEVMAGAATFTPTITWTNTTTVTVTRTITGTPTPTITPTITPTPTINPYNYFIDCGNTVNSISAYGATWMVDIIYTPTPGYGRSGSFTPQTVTYTVYNTPYQQLYQTYLRNNSTSDYIFGVCSAGYYRITFKFADFISTETGQNIFNIYINNTQISNMQNMDVYSLSGFASATDYTVYFYLSTNGLLDIQFTPIEGFAFINALSVTLIPSNTIYTQHIKLNTGYFGSIPIKQ